MPRLAPRITALVLPFGLSLALLVGGPVAAGAQATAWREMLTPLATARRVSCRVETPTARDAGRGVRRVTVHDEGDRADPTNRTIRVYTDSSDRVMSAVVIVSSLDVAHGRHAMSTIVLSLDGPRPQAILLRTAGAVDLERAEATTPSVSDPMVLEPEAAEDGRRLVASLRSAECSARPPG